MASDRFFSIIIPAHNEEYYIGDTLEHINALDYPHDKFEAVVIENGSDDATLQEARDNESDVVTVISIPTRGVSPARNAGLQRINTRTDWIVFLDADTLLSPSFLYDLDVYLANSTKKKCTVCTTALLPINDSRTAKLWFKFYDIGHVITKTSMSIFIIRADVLKNERFDEKMDNGEDLKMIKAALKRGKYFFFWTKTVATSTRRFDKEGWWKILFLWAFIAILPDSIQRRLKYKVVR